jgi:hypothetical protein
VALVVAAIFVAACSSSSNSGDDDESDDDSGGGTFPGGGTGGTVGTGGAMATGGTSSLPSQCAIFCQRTAACPGTQPCQENCESVAADVAPFGCSTQYRRALDCFATVADPCAVDACSVELDSLFACVDGGSAAGCAQSGTGPANGDCVAICQTALACPGAEQRDCAMVCSDGAAQAAMYGCTTSYNRMNGCYSTCTNLCGITADDCSSELVAYADCITCGIDPSNPDCI